MSGILLPGQENRPPQGDDSPAGGEDSGLILPKGYSSKQAEAPKPVEAQPLTPEPTASESEAAAPATDDQAQQPQGQQPQIDLKYPPSGLQVQCPSCSTPYATPVFTIIDLGADLALKTPLLGGQINMAQCPSCGAAGMLSAPLMIHVPEEEFLGVYVPQGGGMDNLQSQKLIGDLTQQLMRDLPTEERKGYILQPQQFFDWNRLIEKIWGFEGVTPEMLRRQAEQSNLVQSLMRLANDDSALELAAERNKELIDRDFFTLIEADGHDHGQPRPGPGRSGPYGIASEAIGHDRCRQRSSRPAGASSDYSAKDHARIDPKRSAEPHDRKRGPQTMARKL